MALRPLYMGLHFYLSQGTASLSHVGAVAHARYMVSPKKEELVRAASDPSIHARYMAERPGSAGMFGADPDHEPNLSEVVETIHHHQGPVWRLIVSVTEEDARALAELSTDSLLQRASWEQACRLVMPQIAEELGLAGLAGPPRCIAKKAIRTFTCSFGNPSPTASAAWMGCLCRPQAHFSVGRTFYVKGSMPSALSPSG